VLVIELKDCELMSALEARLGQLGVKNGAIVSLIGAVDSFTVSTMPAHDASKDIITDYDQPAEMHGAGEVVDGSVHIHATMAVEGDRGVAGHLHRARIGHWFAHVYLAPIEGHTPVE
jgi:predicted DNA-binding protein with PD1-like motif